MAVGFIMGFMSYLFGLRRIGIWLVIGASVNSSVFWLLGALLFIDYLLSERNKNENKY